MDFGKVAVMMGGNSAEREVSLKSGAAVLAALRSCGVDAHGFDPRDKALEALRAEGFQRVFIALHGRGGEDGTLQGALDLLDIPYTGSGVLGSALAMDKWRSKLVWQAAGLPVPDYAVLDAASDFAAVEARLGLPLFVKPANEGSSIGVSKVKEAGGLRAAYELAAGFDSCVIAEKYLAGGEYTVGIVGGARAPGGAGLTALPPGRPKAGRDPEPRSGEHPSPPREGGWGGAGLIALPVIRIVPATEFYDYAAKYLRDDTEYRIPSGLGAERESAMRDLALRAFAVLGGRGWGRMDLMLDEAGRSYCLEANTSPGMTDHSLVPMAARAAGIPFAQLVLRLLEGAGHG